MDKPRSMPTTVREMGDVREILKFSEWDEGSEGFYQGFLSVEIDS